MNNQVVKSNHVIEASYRLTLNEQRLILLCIAQIGKGQVITSQTGFNIRASELIEAFGINSKKAYTELKNVAEVLFNRFLTIYRPDPDEPKLESTRTRWITAIDYIPDEGRIKLYFAHKVIPYISMLESGFTRYKLAYVANMNSVYGMRFYELFKCWLMDDKFKTKSIGLDDLKKLLDLKNQYPSIKDFKLKVLDRGLDDINQHTDLNVVYETKKTGRRITDIEFVITLKSNVTLKQETPKQNATHIKLQEQKEKAADLAHLKKMAELAGIPLETLLKSS